VLGRNQTCTTVLPAVSAESSVQNALSLEVQLATAWREILVPSQRSRGKE